MINRVNWLRLGLWLVVITLLTGYLVHSLKVVTDIGQFMPSDKADLQLRALQGEMQSGPAATNLLLSIHGQSIDELVRLSNGMINRFKGGNNFIASIQNHPKGLDDSLVKTLQSYRYLLTDQDWSEAGLRHALLNRLSDLRSGAGMMIRDYLVSDPFLAIPQYMRAASGGIGPAQQQGVWIYNNEMALLVVKVNSDVLDLDIMEGAMNALRSAFSELEPLAAASLEIAGPGAMAVETRSAIQETTRLLSWVLTILLIVVFGFAYRALHLVLLAGIPLLSATLAGLALTQFIFGQVHGVVIAFGITMLGVCLDYALHLFSHVRKDESPQTTLKRIWPTLRLGAVSSALAYLVLLGSGFEGLNQLAVFAACGLLVALWVTRNILAYGFTSNRIQPRYIQLKRPVPISLRVIIVILMLIVPTWGWLSADKYWENAVEAVSPVPEHARILDRTLRRAIGAPEVSHIFIVEAETKNRALMETEQLVVRLEELVREKIVDRILPVTRLLPSEATQSARQLRIPQRDELAKRLTLATQGTPFRAAAFTPFLDAAESARTQSFITSSLLEKTDLAGLVDQGLIHTETGWLSVIRLQGVSSDKAIQGWLAKNQDLSGHHVQLRQATSSLLQSYRTATIERVLVAFVVLIVLVWIGYRRLRRVMRIMLPVGLGVLSGLAAPLLVGQGLTVFHLLAALLLMGMGLDYSLFFNRDESHKDEKIQSFHAIGISMLTTAIAFFIMSASSVPVLAAMGSVIAFGIIQCFILAWMISTSTQRQENKS